MCLQIGIDDPEAWLAKRPKRVIHLWMAYWRLEPWGLPWHRHAGWMCKLDQILEVLLQWGSGGKSTYRSAGFDKWMPADYEPETKRRRVTLRDQLKIVARTFGGKI